MAESFTRDKIVFQGIRIEWENEGSARIIADWIKMTSRREIPRESHTIVPLNATRQAQLDMIRDLVKNFVLTQEEATEF